jgi:hypothetical protein
MNEGSRSVGCMESGEESREAWANLCKIRILDRIGKFATQNLRLFGGAAANQLDHAPGGSGDGGCEGELLVRLLG